MSFLLLVFILVLWFQCFVEYDFFCGVYGEQFVMYFGGGVYDLFSGVCICLIYCDV